MGIETYSKMTQGLGELSLKRTEVISIGPTKEKIRRSRRKE
jgi:hypothetical protein